MNKLPAQARELLESMLGVPFANSIEAATQGGFGSPLAQLAVKYAFTDVWNRPGLDRRSRSLVTLGMLLALHLPNEFKNHVRAGIANGLTPTEIEELCLHASVYVGLPLGAEAMQAAVAVLREQGLIDSGVKTASERGLL
jgi:4-carboxymuconolactone decarboxylase